HTRSKRDWSSDVCSSDLLMVGATGAGKSTSLAAMLDFRNERRSGHILTLEDPVEYIFVNKKSIVNQREVGTDTKAFEIALRNARSEERRVGKGCSGWWVG